MRRGSSGSWGPAIGDSTWKEACATLGRAGSVGGETAVAAGTTATGTAVAPSSSVADLRGPGLPPRIGECRTPGRDRETDHPTKLAASTTGLKSAAHERHGAMRETLAAADWAGKSRTTSDEQSPPRWSRARLSSRRSQTQCPNLISNSTHQTCAWRLSAAAFNKLTDRVFWVRSPAATRNAAAGWGGIPGFPKHAEKKLRLSTTWDAVRVARCAAKYSHAVRRWAAYEAGCPAACGAASRARAGSARSTTG